MAYASSYTARIQDTDAITPEHVAPFIRTFRPTTPYLTEISGFADVHRQINKMKAQMPDKFLQARGLTGLNQLNVLGISAPSKIKYIKKRSVKVVRGATIPDNYDFTSTNYTNSNPATFQFTVASPGRLIPVNSILQFSDDDAAVVEVLVTSVSPASDGTATIESTVLANSAGTTVLGNVTNSVSAVSIKLIGAFAAESGTVQTQENQTPSTETFNMGKLQSVIRISTESTKINFDTSDMFTVAGDAFIAKADNAVRQMNNMFLFARGGTSLNDPDGNDFDEPAGIVNMTSVGSTDGTADGLGPTNLELMIDNITSVASLESDFEVDQDGRAILDVFCDRTRKVLFDDFMRTSSVFGTTVYVTQKESLYDMHLNTYKGLSASLRVHHDRSFDTGSYTSTVLMINKKSIVPVWLTDHFFRTDYSTGDSNSNQHVFTLTNICGQVALVKDHIQLLTNVTAVQA